MFDIYSLDWDSFSLTLIYLIQFDVIVSFYLNMLVNKYELIKASPLRALPLQKCAELQFTIVPTVLHISAKTSHITPIQNTNI